MSIDDHRRRLQWAVVVDDRLDQHDEQDDGDQQQDGTDQPGRAFQRRRYRAGVGWDAPRPKLKVAHVLAGDRFDGFRHLVDAEEALARFLAQRAQDDALQLG